MEEYRKEILSAKVERILDTYDYKQIKAANYELFDEGLKIMPSKGVEALTDLLFMIQAWAKMKEEARNNG